MSDPGAGESPGASSSDAEATAADAGGVLPIPAESNPTAIDETAIDERSLLAVYVGDNADSYLRAYDRMVASRYGVATWSWPALFVPLAWMLYRKLWVPAAWFIFLPIALVYVFEVNTIVLYIQVAVATQAKQLYVWQAQKRIARILAVDSDPHTIRRKVSFAGGTSAAGITIGSLVTAGAVIFGFVAGVQNAQP